MPEIRGFLLLFLGSTGLGLTDTEGRQPGTAVLPVLSIATTAGTTPAPSHSAPLISSRRLCLRRIRGERVIFLLMVSDSI
jgi:hypothetical protein